MDRFEKEYFESLKKIAPQFENRLHEIAKERIKMFSAAVTRQLLDENQEFDLVFGPGNSGLFMTKITEMVFKSLGKKVPPIVNVPIERIMERNTVTNILIGKAKIPNINKKTASVLFVDDEIMRALTAKACFELLLQEDPGIDHVNATIIAESHFFEWHYNLPKVSVKFFAHARLIQGINGVIGHILTDDIFKEIDVIQEIETYNDALAIVLGGALKKIENNEPYYDFEAENIMKSKVEDYESKKNRLINEIEKLVDEGIKDYQEGKIKFRF